MSPEPGLYTYDRLCSDSIWHKVYVGIRHASSLLYYSKAGEQDVFEGSLESFRGLGTSYCVFLSYVPRHNQLLRHQTLEGYLVKQKDYLDNDVISSSIHEELNKAMLISLLDDTNASFSVAKFCQHIQRYFVDADFTYLEYGWLHDFAFKNRQINNLGQNYSVLVFPVWHSEDNVKLLRGITLLFFHNLLSSTNLVNTRRLEIASENLDTTFSLSRSLFTDDCERQLQHILLQTQLDRKRLTTSLAAKAAELMNCMSVHILPMAEFKQLMLLPRDKEIAGLGQRTLQDVNNLILAYSPTTTVILN